MDLNRTNEHGVPLHACNGYRMDEHYWARIAHRRKTEEAASDFHFAYIMSQWKRPGKVHHEQDETSRLEGKEARVR